MKFKREIVTPYLAFIFIVVGFSGILMFFHLLDDYTNVVHEFLGLIFFLFAILHITINWKSIRNYSKNKMLLTPSIVILILSIGFITIGKIKGNTERRILEKLIKSPVSSSFKALDIDYVKAKAILREHNIVITASSESLEEISIKNQKSPEEIIELIIE